MILTITRRLSRVRKTFRPLTFITIVTDFVWPPVAEKPPRPITPRPGLPATGAPDTTIFPLWQAANLGGHLTFATRRLPRTSIASVILGRAFPKSLNSGASLDPAGTVFGDCALTTPAGEPGFSSTGSVRCRFLTVTFCWPLETRP